MLARAPQLPHFDVLIGFPRPCRRAGHPLFLLPRWGGASRSRRKCGVASAGEGGRGRSYERIPMETPGAYRLVDRDTGDEVIVWGGADDGGEAPIPSPEVLSWSPTSDKGVEVAKRFGAKPDVRTVQSVGNFGRLKAQKVKALIKRSPHIGKESTRYNRVQRAADLLDEDDDGDIAGDDDDEQLESFEGNKRNGTLGSLQNEELRDDIVDDEVRGIGSGQRIGVLGSEVAVSKVNSSVRGWGDVSSRSNSSPDRTIKQRRTAADSGFFSSKSFRDLGCSEDMIKSLTTLMFLRPSHIQAMAYRSILEGKSCIVADQSGSGKTLAYLAPLIQCLRQEEILGLSKSSSSSPRVIILAPTAELASQVLNNCRSISKFGVPFRSMVATGGFRQKTQLDSLQQVLDVLIATPGRFFYLLQEGFVKLNNLKCVVLDEVDILFGEEDFEQVLQRLIASAAVSVQYLFITATLPLAIYNKVVEVFPDCDVLMGPGMHRTSSGLEEVLVDCSGNYDDEKNPDTAFSNKKSALLQLIDVSPVHKTIVFCNKIETCRKVENVLKRVDRKGLHIKVLPFHAALAQEMRLANMKEFINSQSADSVFLVCTDRASRGIDFTSVDHVVLFDFPRDPSEYVRRVGRTARGAGGKGKAYVFVVGKQVSLARRIVERNRKGHPLHEVPCAYISKNPSL